MQCSGGLESFGKKRRKRALVGPEMTIELTTPMSPAAAEDSDSSSESRKFHAQLILVFEATRANVVVHAVWFYKKR